MTHAGHGIDSSVGPLLLVAALAIGYEVLSLRHRWSGRRGASFMIGCAVLAVGMVVGQNADGFRDHMLAHLLIGMFAPLALVLGAPVTLVLRCLPPAHRRYAARVLHARITRFVAHPATALVLTVVPLFALYATPLYLRSTQDPTLHHLLHVHFLAAGYLFAWVVAGPDPAPRRPSVPARLVVLGIAIAAHTTLSQLLYAGVLTPVPGAIADRQAAATLMYYGGDAAELLLAFALLTSWRPRAGRPERPPARRRALTAAQGAR